MIITGTVEIYQNAKHSSSSICYSLWPYELLGSESTRWKDTFCLDSNNFKTQIRLQQLTKVFIIVVSKRITVIIITCSLTSCCLSEKKKLNVKNQPRELITNNL